MTLHQPYPVYEPSDVGNLRSAVKRLARSLGFDVELTGRAALVATEMATNLVKHTSVGGEVLISSVAMGDGGINRQAQGEQIQGIELIALDQGPGMRNPGRLMQDGVSTTASLGGGLGAIRRLSHTFDLYSQPGSGTAILSRLWNIRYQANFASFPGAINVGAVVIAKPGENVCGDGWAVARQLDRMTFLVADGLGHGPRAAEAMEQALQVFQVNQALPAVDIVRKIHQALRGMRGVVLALASLHFKRQELTYIGIGNIAGYLLSPERVKGLISYGGIVGSQLPKIQKFAFPWSRKDALVIHSDGLKSRWDLSAYTGLIRHHPVLVAAVLYRDFARRTDDVVIVVANHQSRE